MIREDALAYLVVLNYKPVLDQLSEDDYKIGRAHIEGCLSRIINQLESNKEDNLLIDLAKAIHAREKENGNPTDPKRFEHLTSLCAVELHQLITVGEFFESVK